MGLFSKKKKPEPAAVKAASNADPKVDAKAGTKAAAKVDAKVSTKAAVGAAKADELLARKGLGKAAEPAPRTTASSGTPCLEPHDHCHAEPHDHSHAKHTQSPTEAEPQGSSGASNGTEGFTPDQASVKSIAAALAIPMLMIDQGDLDGAEPLLRKALEECYEKLGDRHPSTLTSIGNLGSLLNEQGDLDGAEPLLREALEGLRETLGDRHLHTLISIGNYADLLREMGDLGAARRAMGNAPEVARETLGADHANTLAVEAHAARIAIALGEADMTALRDVVARMEAALGAEHPQTRKYSAISVEPVTPPLA